MLERFEMRHEFYQRILPTNSTEFKQTLHGITQNHEIELDLYFNLFDLICTTKTRKYDLPADIINSVAYIVS